MTASVRSYTEDWYYTVEVEPGVFTAGADRANLSVTRKLLRRVRYRGYDCLDVGTMEGVVPTLLERGGAERVVACDRLDLSTRGDLVQRAYQVTFGASVATKRLCAALDDSYLRSVLDGLRT